MIGDQGGRALDLDDLHLRSLFEDLAVDVRARGPVLAADPNQPVDLIDRRSTTALRPTSAAVPVRAIAGSRRCLRAIGRTSASESTEPHDEHDQRRQSSGEGADDRSGGRSQRERAEQEQARGQHLADDEPDRNQRPDEPAHTLRVRR